MAWGGVMTQLVQTLATTNNYTNVTFTTTLPIWVFAVIAVCVIGIVLWTMPSGRTRTGVRWVIMSCRLCAMALAMIILASPSWTRTLIETKPDIVPILVDVSASMNRIERDQSRFKAMSDTTEVLHNASTNVNNQHDRQFEWIAFADTTHPIEQDTTGAPILPSIQEGPTRIGASIQSTIERLDRDHVAGIVLVTDGRGDIGMIESTLRTSGIGVWVIPIGDKNPPPAITIKQLIAPKTAFSEDRIPIQVDLELDGANTNTSIPITLQVVDAVTGDQLSTIEQQIDHNPITRITTIVTPDLLGLTKWRVNVLVHGDIVDTAVVEVDIRDRPLRLLYVEQHPRFFFRFVVPLLTRDQSVDLSVLLQSADEDAAPIGDTPIRRFPDNQDELRAFDLVVLGDVDPESFTEGQLDALHNHALAGAGLLWVPGSNVQSTHWDNTPLSSLLPVAPNTTHHIIQGVLSATAEGESLGLFVPKNEPLAWAIGVDTIRPQARSLIEMTTNDGRTWPALVLLPTGRGRAGWLSSDDLWRWRRGSKGDAGAAFLLSVLRLFARQVEPMTPVIRVVGQPVTRQPTIIVLDGVHTEFGDNAPQHVVEIRDSEGVLRQRVVLQKADMDQSTTQGTWHGLWQPKSSGDRSLSITIAAEHVRHNVVVKPKSTEDMRAGVNIDALIALTDRTGGAIVDQQDAQSIFDRIPRRSSQHTRHIDEGPAFPWLLWSLMAAVLAVEWSVRRWNALA
jgi:hypothetical protein